MSWYLLRWFDVIVWVQTLGANISWKECSLTYKLLAQVNMMFIVWTGHISCLLKIRRHILNIFFVSILAIGRDKLFNRSFSLQWRHVSSISVCQNRRFSLNWWFVWYFFPEKRPSFLIFTFIRLLESERVRNFRHMMKIFGLIVFTHRIMTEIIIINNGLSKLSTNNVL